MLATILNRMGLRHPQKQMWVSEKLCKQTTSMNPPKKMGFYTVMAFHVFGPFGPWSAILVAIIGQSNNYPQGTEINWDTKFHFVGWKLNNTIETINRIETTNQIRDKLRSKPICLHDAVCIIRMFVGTINSPHLWQSNCLPAYAGVMNRIYGCCKMVSVQP